MRASESRLRAMLEAALDAVVTMDHARPRDRLEPRRRGDLRLPRASEAIGREMAELIVPPRLRRRAPAGPRALPREPARPSILDRRLELTGMRSDGTEFPVELTITRIALPGPPTFTGYLRDITDRKRAEQSCAPRAPASSRSPTPSGGGSSATSTTARSSGSPRSCSPRPAARARRTSGTELLDVAIDELAAGLEEIRELASGLHPARAHRARARARRSRRSSLRAPAPGRAATRSRPSGCPSRSRRPRTTSSPRRSRTCRSTPARARVVVRASTGDEPPGRRGRRRRRRRRRRGGRGPARARRPRRSARRPARARQPRRRRHAPARGNPAHLAAGRLAVFRHRSGGVPHSRGRAQARVWMHDIHGTTKGASSETQTSSRS